MDVFSRKCRFNLLSFLLEITTTTLICSTVVAIATIAVVVPVVVAGVSVVVTVLITLNPKPQTLNIPKP